MKKLFIPIILLLALFCITSQLSAMIIDIQINGPDELKNQKDAINRTIETRCLASGIDTGKYNKLGIGINKLGDIYSFDAILDITPPKAFHKDMKSFAELTSTIDEMIASLFSLSQAEPSTPSEAVKDINLDFMATSITLLNSIIYVADNKNIYMVKDGYPTIWSTIKEVGPIFRIWPYQDSIIALCKHASTYNKDEFITYQIKDGVIVKNWTGVTLPMGNGLIRTDIRMIPDLTQEVNRWSSTKAVDGTPDLLPAYIDPLASVIAEIIPSLKDKELITFSSSTGNLLVYSHDMKNPKESSKSAWQKFTGAFTLSDIDKKSIWSSEARFSRLPLYLEQLYMEKNQDEAGGKQREIDYFIPPRITVADKSIVTIDNNQGLWRVLEKATSYKSCQIRVYTWNENDFVETSPLKSSLGYCADIAVNNDIILALIVTDKGTKIRTVSLKGNIK
jgi:hypothetical protein